MRNNEMINGSLPAGTEAIPLPRTLEDVLGNLPRTARRFYHLADLLMVKAVPGYVSRFTNYGSYAKKLREDEKFYHLVQHLIDCARRVRDVESRMDCARLLQEHREGHRDHSRALTALASLGVIVKALG